LGDVPFIPKGQRAELFEKMDNEVPTVRINLPEDEYKYIKNIAKVLFSADYINDEVKEIIYSINEQNFNEIHSETNFNELLPELLINKDGYPNIDVNNYIITEEEYKNLINVYNSSEEIIFNILNSQEHLNLIKVFNIISNLDEYLLNENENLSMYIKRYFNWSFMDDNCNYQYESNKYNREVKAIVSSLNRQILKEIFPGYNFNEILPELPMNENGHPNIDYQKYIIDESENDYFYDIDEIVFKNLRDNEYLNLIKVFYTLSGLNIYEINNNFDDITKNIDKYGLHVYMDDDGNFQYTSSDYIKEINKIVISLNKQNFNEIFPGFDFNESLPELPMNENGHPNIDFHKYVPTERKYQELKSQYSDEQILFDIFNNDTYLNLIKVFNTISQLDLSEINSDDDLISNINNFGFNVYKDNDENFQYISNYYNQYIKSIVEKINKLNFNEIFKGNDYAEILPELPMKDNGHPNIDFRQYLISESEYEELEEKYNNDYLILFNIFNNSKYLNLIKVINTLPELDTSEIKDDESLEYIVDFRNNVIIDDDGNLQYIDKYYVRDIKKIVEYLNKQNLNEIFKGTNYTEILPELPMNENGHPNIDFKKYIISESEYDELDEKYRYNLILFNIFNNSKYLNLIKVIYLLPELDTSEIEDDESLEYIVDFRDNVIIDDDGNLQYIDKYYVRDVKKIIKYLNKQNLNEIFKGTNYTEILPELPMNENGHPYIDFKQYIISESEYEELEEKYDYDYLIIFNIFNNNKYFNLIKLFYLLPELDISEIEDGDLYDYLEKFNNNNIHKDDDGNFYYLNLNKEYFKEIEKIVNTLNEQNFKEMFPEYDFNELLPMSEDGYPNIDYKIFLIPEKDSMKLNYEYNNLNEQVFHILNNNKELNLINVFYILSEMDTSKIIDDDLLNYINEYGNNVVKMSNGEFEIMKKSFEFIKEVIEYLNEQNFNEIFPGYDFSEILPELPMNENGHPNINFRDYLEISIQYEYLYDSDDELEFLFNTFNDNNKLNLIKVFYTISQLKMKSKNVDDKLEYYIYRLGTQTALKDGEFIYNGADDAENNMKSKFDSNYFKEHFENYNFNITNNESKTDYMNNYKTKNGSMTVEINK